MSAFMAKVPKLLFPDEGNAWATAAHALHAAGTDCNADMIVGTAHTDEEWVWQIDQDEAHRAEAQRLTDWLDAERDHYGDPGYIDPSWRRPDVTVDA